MSKLKDMTGQKFNRWTVIKRVGTYASPNREGTTPTYLCRCDCGTERIVIGRNVRYGVSKSCGCLRRELAGKISEKRWARVQAEREANGQES